MVLSRVNVSALPDQGRKLKQQVDQLTMSLQQLNLQISREKQIIYDHPLNSRIRGMSTLLYYMVFIIWYFSGLFFQVDKTVRKQFLNKNARYLIYI